MTVAALRHATKKTSSAKRTTRRLDAPAARSMCGRTAGSSSAALVLPAASRGCCSSSGPLLTQRVIDVALPGARRRAGVRDRRCCSRRRCVVAFGCSVRRDDAHEPARPARDARPAAASIFAHLQRLPVAFFDRNPVGRLVTRVTSDVESLNELFTAGVVAGLGDLFTLLAISVMMLVTDWRLALASFAVIPFVVLDVAPVPAQGARCRIATSARGSRASTRSCRSASPGMRVVQLFGRERERGGAVRRAESRPSRREPRVDHASTRCTFRRSSS